MNVYIDVGAGDADTILQFRNWSQLLPFKGVWKVYGFEPNPELKRKWLRHIRDDTVIYQSAAWVRDDKIVLSIGEPWYKSSVMEEKRDYTEGRKVEVPALDFSKWLEQFRGDTVILKMDCEGAELPILTKMIKDGTDNIATVTMVEWHDGKMPTYQSNKHDILKDYRGRLIEWR